MVSLPITNYNTWIFNYLSRYRRERHSYVRRAEGDEGGVRLRWEDFKRDVGKAGEEEVWKKTTRNRGGWKRLSDEAVKKLRAEPDLTPDKGGGEEEERDKLPVAITLTL